MQWDAAAIDIIEIVDDAESPGPAEIVEVRSHSNSIEVVSDEESLGAPIMRSGSNKASAKDSRSHKLDKARTVRRALIKERKRQQAEMKAGVMSESNSSLERKMWQCAWPKLEKPEGLDLRGRMSLGQVAKLLAIHEDEVQEYRAIVAWAALQQQSDGLGFFFTLMVFFSPLTRFGFFFTLRVLFHPHGFFFTLRLGLFCSPLRFFFHP